MHTVYCKAFVEKAIYEFRRRSHLDAFGELKENFNLQEKEKELRLQLEVSEKMLRQEREEKAALQREYDRMRAEFEPKVETRDIEREAREEIQKSFQEKIRKFFYNMCHEQWADCCIL